MPPSDAAASGGCQCGAVRFRAGRLGNAAICHCRMCQKAFGSYFGPLVTGHEVTWTRGEPAYFRSSNRASRGFCRECGTPLCYREDTGEYELAIGALDDPSLAPPTKQINVGSRVSVFDHLPDVPHHTRLEAEAAFNATVVNHQHPDHDTAQWPPAGGFAA